MPCGRDVGTYYQGSHDRWTQLKSGGIFYPLREQPNFEVITYEDIAHGMSRQYRFGGHLADETVAEHCCILHDIVPNELKLVALMHDAIEGLGLPDVQLPFKNSPDLAGYKRLDERLTEQLLDYFGIPLDLMLTLHKYDSMIAVSEAKAMFKQGLAEPTNEWLDYISKHDSLPHDITVFTWVPNEAKRQWLTRFQGL